MNKKIIFGFALMFFLVGAMGVYAATFINVVSTCSAEDSATKGTFAGACDVTTGASLQNDDASLETHTYAKTTYGGVRVQSVNTSIINCNSVSEVFICYKWWRGATYTPLDCDISVDANGGGSYSAVNTTCPGTTEPAGITCQNVTALETWTCGSFFGASGTRALAKSELTRVTTGAAGTQTGTWDVLFFNVTYSSGTIPSLSNITGSHTSIKGGETITIYANSTANRLNDSDGGTLTLYCDTTNTPNSTNTDCTGGTTTDSSDPYDLTCTFATPITDANNTEYCRVYDGGLYSNLTNWTYQTDATSPSLTLLSVAGDTIAGYFDSNNDGVTEINISGESGMACRWSASDLAYSGMGSACTVSGTGASCSVTGVSEGATTRYISCQDSLANGNNASNNLDVQFTLDYTAPTTYDNSDSSFHAPSYVITITEADNVDSDVLSYYCTSTSAGCSPVTSIDNGGTITYTSANRGTNYLRYYSVDDAGNSQTIVNKTININRLPVFTSAADDAVIIKGGATVNVSTQSYDLDSGQSFSLFVCNSNGATSSGCTGTEYCNAVGTGNLSCTFSSETDSALHTWYAFIYDGLGEAATNNPQTGSYTTDYTNPVLTIGTPSDGQTITQSSLTFSIVSNEALSQAWYTLDSGANNVTMSNTTLYAYSHTNLSIADGYYNLTFYANDSYGNNGETARITFRINTAVADTSAPTITIHSPSNAGYYTSASVLLNISANENLSWAGYRNNSGPLTTLGNISNRNWNSTVSFAEGTHLIEFYANDTSNNQGNANATIYVDLNNPGTWISCDDKNASVDVLCYLNISDAIGIDYYIVGYNFTGSWINTTLIDFSGSSLNTSYTISAGNTTPGTFGVELYVYDLSGRTNLTSSDSVVIYDDTYPGIYNITYSPNTTAELDPDVRVIVNATISEDYNISSVVLMWLNSSDGLWRSVSMDNSSALVNFGSMSVVFNASFVPGNGTYYFKINATDSAGNQNISANYSFVVANDTSLYNFTNIEDTESYTYAQRLGNNSLGWFYLNNTGDGSLDVNVSIVSSISSRFNINYTNDDNASYSISSHDAVNLTILVNTSELSAGLYRYNITIVSSLGTYIYEKAVNVQLASGPYLVASFDSYASSVTLGQSGVEYVASVTNYGTSDATGVSLTISLPSAFTLASGSLTRSFGTLPVGVSGTNTITVSVGSSVSDSSVNISALASSTNADSSSVSKLVTISNPVVVTNTVISGGTTGGGSSGGAGAGGAAIVYSKFVEVVRGTKDYFEIEFTNNQNKILSNVTLSLIGLSEKFYSISPNVINNVGFKEKGKFIVNLNAPSYKDFEQYSIKASVKGTLIDATGNREAYSETQNIKFTIQEVSKEDTTNLLNDAEKAIQFMIDNGFNTLEVEEMIKNAWAIFDSGTNKEAYDIASEIVSIKEKAYFVSDLISRVEKAIDDPKETSLLLGNVVKDLKDEENFSAYSLLTGRAIFSSESTQDVLQMAKAAFGRGDYGTAEERARQAALLLLMERKGNFGLFLYLYWPFIIFVILFLSTTGIVSYRVYQKRNIGKTIADIDKAEINIKNLMSVAQKKYFQGKISATEYHRTMAQYNNDIADLRQKRINLRNRRIKLLKPEQEIRELDSERRNVESDIKKLQQNFFVKQGISKQDYETGFNTYNERLAEIEDERTTIHMMEKTKAIDRNDVEKESEDKSFEEVKGENSGENEEAEKKKESITDNKKIIEGKENTKGKEIKRGLIRRAIERVKYGSDKKIKDKVAKMLAEKNKK